MLEANSAKCSCDCVIGKWLFTGVAALSRGDLMRFFTTLLTCMCGREEWWAPRDSDPRLLNKFRRGDSTSKVVKWTKHRKIEENYHYRTINLHHMEVRFPPFKNLKFRPFQLINLQFASTTQVVHANWTRYKELDSNREGTRLELNTSTETSTCLARFCGWIQPKFNSGTRLLLPVVDWEFTTRPILP